MYKYYNAHPKGLWVDDSIDRAIAVTTRMEYSSVGEARAAHKKCPSDSSEYSLSDPRRYIEDVLMAKRMTFSKHRPLKMTGARFSKTYKSGRYILDMGWHFSACVEGVILDTWDCSDETVLAAYPITPVNDSQRINLRLCYTYLRVGDDRASITFYDNNGRPSSKTLLEEEAREYAISLEKRGYSDMTNACEWL